MSKRLVGVVVSLTLIRVSIQTLYYYTWPSRIKMQNFRDASENFWRNRCTSCQKTILVSRKLSNKMLHVKINIVLNTFQGRAQEEISVVCPRGFFNAVLFTIIVGCWSKTSFFFNDYSIVYCTDIIVNSKIANMCIMDNKRKNRDIWTSINKITVHQ